MTLRLLLYLVGTILLFLAAFGISWRVSFGWLGLAVISTAAFILPAL